ncbi:hypothetical protein AURDEDRAFT_155522 [Auricularia subglabra TFB-10046 SS5]|nr:hypothetical protein AURDEDRAFT_155522 [Auricularia subglabra TFB-10046 SS5]
MARATRSSTQHQIQPQNGPGKAGAGAAAALKGSKKAQTSKKRKRPSNASADVDPELADSDDDAEGQPAAKHPRPEPTYKDAADTPLQPQDALQILAVLQSIDRQGLLDRAFPPPASDGPSSSRATLSLKQLLLDAQAHPLRALRDAVQPLQPITSHVRSHDSDAAHEQKRFCSLALALLEQASRHTIDFNRTSAFFEEGEQPAAVPPVRRKYALMQKLPNGEWWTSPLASDDPRVRLSAREARALKHGEAELVSILPAAVDAFEDADVPTLGGYAPGPKKDKRGKPKQPQGINVPTVRTGSFLDYGPWASFAPSFDSDAAEVGRDALGALYDARARRRIARQKQEHELPKTAATASADEDAMQVDEGPATTNGAIDPALSALSAPAAAPEPTPADDVSMLMNSIVSELELEKHVSELLQRNARAIADLELMQLHRLSRGASVEKDSEEWRTATQILDTLALLASLRPRGADSDQAPLVPPPHVLHTLQRTLPLEANAGFKGTLADGRQAALRDNNTVRVKVAGTATAASTSTATTKAAAAAPATPSPATPAQRFPAGVPYPFPPPTHPYYPNANYQSAGHTAAAPAGAAPYPPYAPGYFPGYFPYPFAPPPRDKAMSMEAAQKFYAYGAQGAAGNAAKAAGAGTPAQNGWPAYPGMPVTLPPHLRRYPAQPFPGTPTPAGR